MREALAWIFAAIVLGCALAFGLVMWLAPPAHAAAQRPYDVYRIPRGCLYIATIGDRNMVFVPDTDDKSCDGALVVKR